ncbi:MAG: alanine--tRNA ligase-related protein, partial [Patescibacteria group bacterium]
THLTFFEMLGNFSFGGYGKKEAIKYAWEFLTSELGIKSQRISFTIFSGDKDALRDDESAEALEEIGLKYQEGGRADNFWGPVGNEGPCGRSIEIYVDDVEIWTLVFNEYYYEDGKYEPLKTKGVDTGMGLERMLVVLNGLKDVYQTDVFEPLIKKIEEISGQKYQDFPKEFRIIADHIKAVVFAIEDRIVPSNKDRGYTVRRLIRKGITQFYKMKCSLNQDLIIPLTEKIFEVYPEINFEKNNIIPELIKESGQFFSVLNLSEKQIKSKSYITGKDLFNLHQSFATPPEISTIIAEVNKVKITPNALDEYQEQFDRHREISRAGVSGFKGGLVGESEITTRMHTATHLLLKALQIVLGPEVHQRGSNINPERIRFDFSYPKPLADDEIKKVEEIVNQKITENLPVEKKEVTLEEAKKLGAEAQFVEKYTKYDKLTLYSIGDPSTSSGQAFSHELCGGPHVQKTGEIGKFKIIKEESS